MKRHLFAALAVALLTAAAGRSSEPTANASLQEARRLFEAGKYAQAAAGFQAVAGAHPSAPEAAVASYYIGLSEERRGRREAALEAYRAMIARYPSDALAGFARQRSKEVERDIAQNPNAAPPVDEAVTPVPGTAVDRLARNVVRDILDRAQPPSAVPASRSGSRTRGARTAASPAANPASPWPAAVAPTPVMDPLVRFPEHMVQRDLPAASAVREAPGAAAEPGLRVVTFPSAAPVVSPVESPSHSRPVVTTSPLPAPVAPSLPGIPVGENTRAAASGGMTATYVRRSPPEMRPVEFEVSGGREASVSAGSSAAPLVSREGASVPVRSRDSATGAWWEDLMAPTASPVSSSEPPWVPSPASVIGGSRLGHGQALEGDEPASSRAGAVTLPPIVLDEPVMSLLSAPIALQAQAVSPAPTAAVTASSPAPIEPSTPSVPSTAAEARPDNAAPAGVEPPILHGLDDAVGSPVEPSSAVGSATTPAPLAPENLPAPALSTLDAGWNPVPMFEASSIEASVPPPSLESLPAPVIPSWNEAPAPVIPTSPVSDLSLPPSVPSAEPVLANSPSSANGLPAPLYSVSLDSLRRAIGADASAVISSPSSMAGSTAVPEGVERVRPASPETRSPAESHLAKAIEYRKLNLLDQAVAEYQKALEVDPENPVVKNNLADLYVERGERLEEAIDLVTEALRGSVTDRGPYYSTLGWAYARMGDLVNAEKFMNESLKVAVTSARLYRRARIYAAMGMAAKARADLDRALVYSEDAATSTQIRRAYEEIDAELPIQGTVLGIR